MTTSTHAFKALVLVITISSTIVPLHAQPATESVHVTPVGMGWANNSVNAVIFRRNSIVTWRDTQYISFYDQDSQVVIGKRKTDSAGWKLQKTPFTGNTTDAHNAISIMADGNGYLHLAWDHHNTPLRYAISTAPGSLEFTTAPMTGTEEQRVTYPEFFRLPNGNLLFLYRTGQSGEGKLIVKEYDISTRRWTSLHNNLVDGEGQRSAYWQGYVDVNGTFHLSWVWRESPDVASNHDMCYARSKDNGRTWETSEGKKYALPITAASAEYVWKIPQQHELINQTSMSADKKGNAFIATYWREPGSDVPQYHILYRKRKGWEHVALGFRKTPFSLSGMGTKKIPIARPQIAVTGRNKSASAILIFRDAERGNKVSVARIRHLKTNEWTVADLNDTAMGAWEPAYDTELWKEKKRLHLFLQPVEQADAEGLVEAPPTMVSVLEWKPDF